MDVATSFWLCSLLAVVSMSVTIGCLWCCICAMAWTADCESLTKWCIKSCLYFKALASTGCSMSIGSVTQTCVYVGLCTVQSVHVCAGGPNVDPFYLVLLDANRSHSRPSMAS